MLLNLKNGLALRQMHGYQLARKLGIPAPHLSEIIHGRRDASPELRRKAARILRCDEAWLFQPVDIPTDFGRRAPADHARAGGAA